MMTNIDNEKIDLDMFLPTGPIKICSSDRTIEGIGSLRVTSVSEYTDNIQNGEFMGRAITSFSLQIICDMQGDNIEECIKITDKSEN